MRCELRSRNAIEAAGVELSAKGKALAVAVSGEATALLLDDGAHGALLAEGRGVAVQAELTTAGMVFHGPRERLFAGFMRPRKLVAERLEGSSLRGRFELPPGLTLVAPTEPTLDVPCGEARFGMMSRDEVGPAGGARELMDARRPFELRLEVGATTVATLVLDGIRGADVLERRGGQAKVRFVVGGKDTMGLDAVEIVAWVAPSAFKKVLPSRPSAPSEVSMVMGGGPDRPARPTTPVVACDRELPLFALRGGEAVRVGITRKNAQLALGQPSGEHVPVIGAGWWLNSGTLFHNPLTLARGVSLAVRGADADAACSPRGTWELP